MNKLEKIIENLNDKFNIPKEEGMDMKEARVKEKILECKIDTLLKVMKNNTT